MRKILTQSGVLFLAQFSTRLLGFFYTIFLARNLGVGDFGLYSLVLAYFSILSSVADFGFNRFFIREVAKDNLKIPKLLWNTVLLRLSVTSVLFAVFSIILYLLDPDKFRVSLVLLASLAILPQGAAVSIDAVFVALSKLQFSALSLVLSSFTTAIAGFILIILGFGIQGAVAALLIGQLFYGVFLLAFLQKNNLLHFSPINFTVVKSILIGSLPYGLLTVIGLVSFRIDTLILAYFKGNFDTGIYGAAYKFLDAVIFIPAALATASFPIFAKSLEDNLTHVKKLYFKSLKIMLFAGLSVMLLYIFLIPEVMKLLLPSYLPSAGVLRILALAIPLIFLHVPSGQVLLSSDKYLKDLLVIYCSLFAINLILYLLFIPAFGPSGAAWITVISEIFTFSAFFIYLTKKVFKGV